MPRCTQGRKRCHHHLQTYFKRLMNGGTHRSRMQVLRPLVQWRFASMPRSSPRTSDSLLQLDLLPAGATKKHAAPAESVAWCCVLLWCFAELEAPDSRTHIGKQVGGGSFLLGEHPISHFLLCLERKWGSHKWGVPLTPPSLKRTQKQ